MRIWFAMALALGLAACDDGKAPGDGAGGVGGGGGDGKARCVVGVNRTADAALEVGLDEIVSGHVCPRRDVDWLRFEVPAGLPLVTVEVGFAEGAISPVALAYEIFRAPELGKPVASATDADTGDNRSSLKRRHYLGAEAGSYLIRIHDAADVNEDLRNAWRFQVSAEADPDRNEPNESCAEATELEGAMEGAISFEGDRDAFAFDVGASQIVEVHARSAKSQVALKLSLYDATGRLLDERSDPRRGQGSDVSLRRGIESAGRVCVVVEDVDGDVADPVAPYIIEATLLDEIDPNDRGVRNDQPATATSLGRGGVSQGSIFSPGDLDWFRVDALAGEILEVELACDDCDFDLAVNLVYGHESSPCSGDDACDYLLTARSCDGGGSCPSGVCRQTPEGALCAASCGSDLDCPSFQCQQAGGVKACVGSAVCVPAQDGGSCGVVQYGVIADTGVSQQIRFAQPVLRGPVYLLVHDFRDDEWSAGTYTLRASLRQDPDPNEVGGALNNFYLPYLDITQLPDPLRRGRERATPAPWVEIKELQEQLDEETGLPVLDDETGLPVMEEVVIAREARGEGCIGFTADVDVFRTEGGNPCGAGNCGMILETDRPAGGPMDLAWFVMSEGMSPRTSFLESQTRGDHAFGDSVCGVSEIVECNVYNANDQGDYYVVVYDSGLDDWDPDGSHCYTWKMIASVEEGCPDACPTPHASSGLCTCAP